MLNLAIPSPVRKESNNGSLPSNNWLCIDNSLPLHNLRNTSKLSLRAYDTTTRTICMDAVDAVAGFETHDQITTLCDMFRHVSLKHQNKTHLAYSDRYELIITCDMDESTHFGVYSTTKQHSSTKKIYIKAMSRLNNTNHVSSLNSWQKNWENIRCRY